MIPTILHIGPLPLHSFGLMMVLAFLAAWRRFYLSLAEGGERPELAEPAITWAALGGILGARLGYLVSFEQDFFSHPIQSIFGGAGFVFHWGFVGGVLAVALLLKKERAPFLRYADLAGPALAIGYAVGRIGCQLSGDGDYGIETLMPWAMGYPLGVVPTLPGQLVHPAPVYETLMALCSAALLLLCPRFGILMRTGQRFGLYLVLAGAARFVAEVVRIEPRIFAGFTQAQLMGFFLVGVGALLIALAKPPTSTT